MTRILSLLLAFLLCCPGLNADSEKEKKQLQKLGSEIKALQENIKDTSKQVRLLETALEASEKQLAESRREIDKLENSISQQTQQLNQLDTKKQQLTNLKENQQQALVKQVKLSYRLGSEPTLKLLLNQQDAAEVSRLLRYHDYFLRARAKKLADYFKTLNNLATVELEISATLTSLKTERLALKHQRDQQARVQKSRADTLKTISQSLAQDNKTLKQMLVEKKRLEAVIQKLSQAASITNLPSSIAPFSGQKGKLDWPVDGTLKNRFGQNRNIEMQWQGLLLSALEGTPITSIHNGRVVFADYLRGHGMLIVIDHGEGFMSLYAHNQMLLAETGDWISGGTTIARVGKTGGQKQSGLYFEIRHNGKPINPAQWLKSKK